MPRDGSDRSQSRRRFLKVTGATAITSAVAGCPGGGGTDTPTPGGDGDGDGGATPTATQTDTGGDGDGGTPTDEDTPTPSEDLTGEDLGVPLDSYPYATNQTAVGKAKQLMEQAGYGPNNKYELSWLQYTSPTWKEMANTIRSRLEAAHIEMSISEASFGPLLEQTRKGQHEAFTLGWIADYPGPQNFVQLINPPNTVYGEGQSSNGARLFWSENAKASSEVRQFMVDKMNVIKNNPAPTDAAAQKRGKAAISMEEGMWAEAAMIPLYHRADGYFWYDRVDYNPPGGLGASRSKESNSIGGIQGKSRLDGISATFNTLDPVASGDTASGGKIQNMFDAMTNYHNGTTEVRNLLAEEVNVTNNARTYEFKLKEGVTFHNGDELTADDMVYSLRRLMESSNSTNLYFPVTVMGIEHEKTEDGGVKPNSEAIEKTGEYSVKVTLEKPFAFASSVFAYSAFSAVPENIVGDIQGYDGQMSYQEFSTSNPIGAGPFRFVKWEQGNGGEFVMDRYDDYHGDAAAIEGIDEAIITDANAQYNYFINGNADVSGIPTAKFDPAKENIQRTDSQGRKLGTYGPLPNGQTLQYAKVPTITSFYIGFNMEKVPRAVRQAMAYVINHEQFMRSTFKNRYESAFHIQPPQVFLGGSQAYNSHYQG